MSLPLESSPYSSTTIGNSASVPSKSIGGRSRRRKGGGMKTEYHNNVTKTGGQGASDYAQSVYGGIDGQTAGIGNHIQMNQVRNGGNVLNDIAVPAVLLYANHRYGRRGGPKNTFRRKGRKGRRGSRRRRSFRRRR